MATQARRPLAALGRRRLRPLDRPRRDGRLAARHGIGVRDARRRRDLLGADGDPEGDPPDRRGQERRLGQAEAQARDLGRCRLHGHEDPRGERPVRHRGRARTTARRPPARRAPPRSTPTPGSAATRRGSGTTVWVGYPRGKVPMTSVHGIAVAGGTFPAQIWRLFMSSAIGQLEPVDFPEPKRLARVEGLRARPVRAGRSATTRTTTTRRPRRRPRRRRRAGATDTVPDAPPASQPPPKQTRLLLRPSAPPPATTAPPPRAAGDHRARAALTRAPPARAQVRSRLLVAGCVACAWVEGAPLVPADGGRADGGSLGALFLALLVARLRRVPDGRSCCCGSATPALRAVVVAAVRDPADPARRPAARLDGCLDVLGVRPDRGGARRRSLRRHAERVPGRSRLRQGRRRLARDDVGVRACLHAPLRGRRARVRLLGRRGGVDLQGARGARRARPARCSRPGSPATKPYAAALVGWNPLFAIHFAGGGHNDSILIALTLGALALAAAGRKQLAGAAWALAVLIKWVPLVFFALRAVAARAVPPARRPRRLRGRGRRDHRARDLALRPRLGAVGRPARPERGGAVELRAAASARAARRAARAHVRAHGRGARGRSRLARRARRHAAGSGSGSPAACCSRPRPG